MVSWEQFEGFGLFFLVCAEGVPKIATILCPYKTQPSA
jgi:hypothetical protein